VAKLSQILRRKQEARFDTALAIAKADPKSDTGFACLELLLGAYHARYLPAAQPALELLTEHHAANPKIHLGIATLDLPNSGTTDQDPLYGSTLALLEAAAQKNPDTTVRGQATLRLAGLAIWKYQMAAMQARPDTEELANAAERALEGVIKCYGEFPNIRREATTLGDEATRHLYELRHLRIGKQAPDIIGEDLSGARFKLSDYRGKVVLLVFWASWCGPCIASVPHEKELVERFKGRPFAVIGVNADAKALRINAPLATAYYLREDLRQIWAQPNKATAQRVLDDWIRRAEVSGIRMLQQFARTLALHRTGILAWYDSPISTGPLEGTNTKIQVMKRQAYGFRDKEFFRLKILGLHETKHALVG
jgi:thiol-disulfide isomerase/thioredoxin